MTRHRCTHLNKIHAVFTNELHTATCSQCTNIQSQWVQKCSSHICTHAALLAKASVITHFHDNVREYLQLTAYSACLLWSTAISTTFPGPELSSAFSAPSTISLSPGPFSAITIIPKLSDAAPQDKHSLASVLWSEFCCVQIGGFFCSDSCAVLCVFRAEKAACKLPPTAVMLDLACMQFSCFTGARSNERT